MQNIYSSVLYKKFPVIKCILQIIEKDKTFGMHILERKNHHFEMIKSRSRSFSKFHCFVFQFPTSPTILYFKNLNLPKTSSAAAAQRRSERLRSDGARAA